MRIDLTDLSPVKKSLAVEVEAEEVEKEIEAVLRQYQKKARVPGFRAGKAPMNVIRSHFGKEADEDVKEKLVARMFFKATREKGLDPLGEPVLEEMTHEKGRPLAFKTTFEVLPEVHVQGHEGIEVLRPSTRVAQEEIEKTLDELREARVRHVVADAREATRGDVVVADMRGTPEQGEPFESENMSVEIGAPQNLPPFNDELLGVRAGESRKFQVAYPEGYQAKHLAGTRVQFEVRVREVKRRELPDLDDDFAKDLGEFDDLAALRARIREDLEHRKAHEADGSVRQALLNKLLLQNPVVLPDILVENELRRRLEELVRSLILQGMDPEKAEIDWVEMRKRQEEPARKAVHARLILDALARERSIRVDRSEVDDKIRREAGRTGEKFEKLKARLQKHGGEELVENQLLREKSLDYLTSVANIQDEE